MPFISLYVTMRDLRVIADASIRRDAELIASSRAAIAESLQLLHQVDGQMERRIWDAVPRGTRE